MHAWPVLYLRAEGVKKSALLEWRLMIARAVLRHELLFFFAPEERKLAGEAGADGKHYHSFLHVRPDPDGRMHVPLLLAQAASASLFDSSEAGGIDDQDDFGGDDGDGEEARGDGEEEEEEANALFGRSMTVTSAPFKGMQNALPIKRPSGSSDGEGGIMRRSTTTLFSFFVQSNVEESEREAGNASGTGDGGGGTNAVDRTPSDHEFNLVDANDGSARAVVQGEDAAGALSGLSGAAPSDAVAIKSLVASTAAGPEPATATSQDDHVPGRKAVKLLPPL